MRWQQRVFGWWWAVFLAPATAQQVEFPLGYYSFEDISRQMSVVGKRVVCAPDLRQRLALVHLKPRSWHDALVLLEQALEVRFRPVSEGRWRLERDPAVAQRDRRLRERLARALDAHIASEFWLLQACLNPKVPAEHAATQIVQRRYAHLPPSVQSEHRARLRYHIERAQSMPLAAALRNWRAYEQFQQHLERFRARGHLREFLQQYPLASFGFSEEERRWAAREAQQRHTQGAVALSHSTLETDDPLEAQARLLLHLGQVARAWMPLWALERIHAQLRLPLRAQEALTRGQLVRTQTVRLPPEIAAWLLEDPFGDAVPLYATEELFLRLQIRATWGYDGGYAYAVQVDHPHRAWRRTDQLPRVAIHLQWAPAEAHSHLQVLDRTFAKAYAAAYTQHQQLLKAPVLQAPLPEAGSTLVETLALWAKTYHQEVIAEVYEDLQTLAVFGDLPKEMSLAALLNRLLEPCLLERRDSVWVLRHWAAFVRRASNPPSAALYQLERTRGDYSDWQAYYRATTAQQAQWLLSNADWKPPRLGVPLPKNASERQLLGYAWLVMAVLENLPEVLRDSLWEGRLSSVSLAVLPTSTRRTLARFLRESGITTEHSASWDAVSVGHLWLVRTHDGWQLTFRAPEPPHAAPRHFPSAEEVLIATPFPCTFSRTL